MPDCVQFLQTKSRIILDGATGTELSRRGVNIGGPSWTAAAIREYPDVLLSIHRDYVAAGAQIITANTFRTHARNLESIGLADEAAALTLEAVQLAREAAGERAFVAGSMAPLGDCYLADQVPSGSQQVREHRRHAEHLARAGVDLVLIETQISVAEAVAAARAVHETGLPMLVSFYCQWGPDAQGRLPTGEKLTEAFAAVREWSPSGLLVNCVPADEVLDLLPDLQRGAAGLRWGVYPNTGKLLSDGSWRHTTAVDPAVFAELAKQWISFGATFAGGCCGTGPEHISGLFSVSCVDVE